ncbi:DUF1289 domain-containing protein [Halopseudomonas pelagia]|uniref:DUF1289 domain-containing protein n=1 Tax=Halopseudomonas pelagia TaxID=553151 RepID=UPI0003B47B94|nr:DUF1289 domain-containing protein [Halopseudomonas pelagia]
MSDYITKKPCIDICKFNRHDICKACGRTYEEKKSWKRLSDQDKQAIWTRVLNSHGSGSGKAAKALRTLYHNAQDRAASKR